MFIGGASWTALAAVVLHVSSGTIRAQAPSAQDLNQRAVRALKQGETASAIRDLEKARRLAPGDPRIAFNLGFAYVQAARFVDAIEPLKRALDDPAGRNKAMFLLGTCEFQVGQYKLAAAHLEPLRSQPEFAEKVLYFLEESYRNLRNVPAAESAFSELQNRYPDSALLHKLLGTAYDADGRWREALAEFEKAAERDPTLPEVKFDAGLLCLKLHDDEGARKWMTSELAHNPCLAAALYYLGEIDRRAVRLQTAEGFYRKAIGCAPSYTDAYLGLGITLQAQGREADAVPAFRRAVELTPDRADAHFQLARSLGKLGQSEESRRELRIAKELAAANDAK